MNLDVEKTSPNCENRDKVETTHLWPEHEETIDNNSSIISNRLTGKKLTKKPATQALWYMIFFGCAMNFVVRVNMNIAIVDMIIPASKSINTNVSTQCYSSIEDLVAATQTTTNISFVPKQRFSLERSILNFMKIDYSKNGFDWNAKEQNYILASVFWIIWITPIPGSFLARKYGPKRVFGLSIFIASILCLLIPMLTFIDYRLILLIRALQGLLLGFSFPSVQTFSSKWIPPNERSEFFSSFLGVSIGTAIFYPLFGYVAAWTSWEWIFHLSAYLGILWFIVWEYLVFDSPAQHPRIGSAELEAINSSLDKITDEHKNMKIPWRQIMTSKPVWSIIVMQTASLWGIFIVLVQTPTYFKNILGWSIGSAGLISGVPHIAKIIFGSYFSKLADYLLKREKMSRRNVRVLAGIINTIIFGLFTFGLAFSGCNSTAAMIFVILGVACHGALSTSSISNMADISPNFADTLMACIATVTIWPSFVSSYVVGYLTYKNETVEQWQYIFILSGVILIFGGLVYALFTETDVQKWNNPTNNKMIDNNIDEAEVFIDSKLVDDNIKLSKIT